MNVREYILLGFMLFGEESVKHYQLIPQGMIKKVRYLKWINQNISIQTSV